MKKYFLLIFIIAAAALMVTACNRGNNNGTQPTTGQPAANQPASNQPAANQPAAEIDYSLPWQGDTITLRGFGADLGINEGPNNPTAALLKERMGNVEIVWETVPMADYAMMLTLHYNSGDLPDIVWVNRSNTWVPGFADMGLLLDFNEFRNYMPNFNAAVSQHSPLEIYTNKSGQLVMLPQWDNDFLEEGWFANMDVLDRHGIAIPTTFAEFEAALQILADSPENIVPFHTQWNLGYHMSPLGFLHGIQNSGGGMFWDFEKNEWNHHFLVEDAAIYKKMISLMADFYAKGFLDPEFLTLTWDQTSVIMASGNWGFTYTYGVQPNDWLNIGPMEDNPIRFQAFLHPAAEGHLPLINPTNVSDNPGWSFAASANTQYPSIVAAVLDLVYNPEVSTMYQWGIEGESFYFDESGNRQWLPEFLAGGVEARRGMGIWNTMLPRYVTVRDDLSHIRGQAAFKQELYTILAEAVHDGRAIVRYPAIVPTFTQEQLDENASINTPVNTIRDQGVMQFILGQRPMSDWSNFVNEVRAAGDISRVVHNHNSAPVTIPMPRTPATERNLLIP